MGASEELKRFEKDLRENAGLREKLDEAFKRIGENKEAENDGDIMAKAAAELGYSFTATDLDQAAAAAQELDPEEMEMASGGAFDGNKPALCVKDYNCVYAWEAVEDESGHNVICVTAWHCYTVTCHTESNQKNTACWSNYNCKLIYEDKDDPYTK